LQFELTADRGDRSLVPQARVCGDHDTEFELSGSAGEGSASDEPGVGPTDARHR
jgi:hypothetical protein